jgi:transcriptional regulator with XRE-family HTH domain
VPFFGTLKITIFVDITFQCGRIYTTDTRVLKRKHQNMKGGGFMFGEFVKEKRIEKGVSLREFSKLIEVDPSNWSKVERGLNPPPQDDGTLRKIAEALDIQLDSPLWEELKDMAAVGAGAIPKDILSDKKVVNALPMFFRTLRSEKPTPEDLDKLIEIIRKEESREL